jgi:hypothetical protein
VRPYDEPEHCGACAGCGNLFNGWNAPRVAALVLILDGTPCVEACDRAARLGGYCVQDEYTWENARAIARNYACAGGRVIALDASGQEIPC